MDVTFKNEDEYEKFMNRETHSDQGIRTNGGRLGPQLDIKVIDEVETDSENIRHRAIATYFDFKSLFLGVFVIYLG